MFQKVKKGTMTMSSQEENIYKKIEIIRKNVVLKKK